MVYYNGRYYLDAFRGYGRLEFRTISLNVLASHEWRVCEMGDGGPAVRLQL